MPPLHLCVTCTRGARQLCLQMKCSRCCRHTGGCHHHVIGVPYDSTPPPAQVGPQPQAVLPPPPVLPPPIAAPAIIQVVPGVAPPVAPFVAPAVAPPVVPAAVAGPAFSPADLALLVQQVIAHLHPPAGPLPPAVAPPAVVPPAVPPLRQWPLLQLRQSRRHQAPSRCYPQGTRAHPRRWRLCSCRLRHRPPTSLRSHRCPTARGPCS
jgi:hypothetical protein